MVISAQIVTTPMNKRFMMYLTMQHSSRSGFFSSEEAAERSALAASLHLFTVFCFYKQNIEDSLMLLEEESDEEMKELAKEELNESKANVERLEEELKILLNSKGSNG